MADPQAPRVAVYLDFDNIVMSWYDRVHGRNSYARDRARIAETPSDPEIVARLSAATIDVGAIIDYAASFGTIVLVRAYADWSSPVNAVYRSQLVARAVDLVQLFPAAAYAKNGADIRLAVDAVEDMFRLPDLSHVVVVAGDSDYVPLAQRCKRLGRYVIGVGVAGSTAKSLAAACDEFESYDSLPGVEPVPARAARTAATGRGTRADAAPTVAEPVTAGGRTEAAGTTAADGPADAPADALTGSASEPAPQAGEAPASAPAKRTARRARSNGTGEPIRVEDDPQDAATRLLERALRLGHEREDEEWLHSSAVKQHMRRMDPSFSEKALGFRSFSDFVKARDEVAELEETGHERLVRLHPSRA